MDRRQFMQLSAAGLLGLTVGGQISLEAKRMRKKMVIIPLSFLEIHILTQNQSMFIIRTITNPSNGSTVCSAKNSGATAREKYIRKCSAM